MASIEELQQKIKHRRPEYTSFRPEFQGRLRGQAGVHEQPCGKSQ